MSLCVIVVYTSVSPPDTESPSVPFHPVPAMTPAPSLAGKAPSWPTECLLLRGHIFPGKTPSYIVNIKSSNYDPHPPFCQKRHSLKPTPGLTHMTLPLEYGESTRSQKDSSEKLSFSSCFSTQHPHLAWPGPLHASLAPGSKWLPVICSCQLHLGTCHNSRLHLFNKQLGLATLVKQTGRVPAFKEVPFGGHPKLVN